MEEQGHQRRLRYRGTHPRAFAEKYKELQPEKYADDVARVMERGSTPAGMHRSICVPEILELLQIAPGEIGLDATLGYGGHTQAMLGCLRGAGHVYALDVDPLELPRTRARLEAQGYGAELLSIRQMNFSRLGELAAEVGPFDFVLADLGVSSMQIDNPARGFTFKKDGPLDLRLNPEKGSSAAELLATLSRDELQGILMENADEPHAEVLARAICAAQKRGGITTTMQLRDVIRDTLQALPAKDRAAETKSACQRCFQALRIEVNHELEALYAFLEALPAALAPGGRVAMLSFHSGEDRLVKKSFQQFFRAGCYRAVAPEPLRPSAEECGSNSRARSAKLRWAIRA